jgi:hypothetical protein
VWTCPCQLKGEMKTKDGSDRKSRAVEGRPKKQGRGGPHHDQS